MGKGKGIGHTYDRNGAMRADMADVRAALDRRLDRSHPMTIPTTPEGLDAVIAEMRKEVAACCGVDQAAIADSTVEDWADRLAALAREAAGLREQLAFQAALTKELLPYQERAVNAEARVAALEKAMRELRAVLGPNVPTSVTDKGARWEWEKALEILDNARRAEP